MQEGQPAIEAFAMKLANRIYLYRILHIAFGSEPTEELITMLGSGDTTSAIERLAQFPQAARVHIEQKEPDGSSRIAAVEALRGASAVLVEFAHADNAHACAENLASDYVRLFLVPGSAYVYPWESPYVGQETMIFQESTLDVKARYRQYGFAAASGEGRFPEDHIAMMFDFMARVSERAFDAFGNGDDEKVLRDLAFQKDFIETHLSTWISQFYNEVRKKDTTGFYACLASVAALFIEIDALFLCDVPEAYKTITS